ncbi:MAG TPA: hypothetical protein PKL83_06255 [bacterium]|nr:hypothetical protein [bacterium]
MCLIKLIKRTLLFIVIISLLIIIFLSKCSFEEIWQEVTGQLPGEISVSIPEEATPLVDETVARAAEQYGVSPADVHVKKAELIFWPNTCLGTKPQPRQTCQPIVTPGYKIIVEVKGVELEYHTDKQGSILRYQPS